MPLRVHVNPVPAPGGHRAPRQQLEPSDTPHHAVLQQDHPETDSLTVRGAWRAAHGQLGPWRTGPDGQAKGPSELNSTQALKPHFKPQVSLDIKNILQLSLGLTVGSIRSIINLSRELVQPRKMVILPHRMVLEISILVSDGRLDIRDVVPHTVGSQSPELTAGTSGQVTLMDP